MSEKPLVEELIELGAHPALAYALCFALFALIAGIGIALLYSVGLFPITHPDCPLCI